MRNIKLTIEYDGTNYCGWQVQSPQKSHKPSIQERIERTLRKILQDEIRLIASGRTDAGVHALAQAANFKTKSNIKLEKLQRAMNSLLPDDIAITGTEEVNPHFHSRFDAKSKAYRYTVLNRAYPSALLKNKVYFYPYPLDLKLMRKEARCLLGRHDFRSFCASGSGAKTTRRNIKKIIIKKSSYDLSLITSHFKGLSLIVIEIEANGFLYNMVRNIVGTLLEIARGKFPPRSLRKILSARNRKLAGPTAPACGLCLLRVKY